MTPLLKSQSKPGSLSGRALQLAKTGTKITIKYCSNSENSYEKKTIAAQFTITKHCTHPMVVCSITHPIVVRSIASVVQMF